MLKIQRIIFYIILLLLTGLAACSFGEDETDRLNIPLEKQDFHWRVSETAAEKVPYTLSGEQENWKIVLQVRQATDEDKEWMATMLQENKAVTEIDYEKHHVTEEYYEQFCKKYDEQIADVSSNPVYITTMMGQYLGEETIYTESDSIFYQLISAEGTVLLAGGKDINSIETPWYSSNNTLSGSYATGMFVPPLEESFLLIQYDDEAIRVPLKLNTQTN